MLSQESYFAFNTVRKESGYLLGQFAGCQPTQLRRVPVHVRHINQDFSCRIEGYKFLIPMNSEKCFDTDKNLFPCHAVLFLKGTHITAAFDIPLHLVNTSPQNGHL